MENIYAKGNKVRFRMDNQFCWGVIIGERGRVVIDGRVFWCYKVSCKSETYIVRDLDIVEIVKTR